MFQIDFFSHELKIYIEIFIFNNNEYKLYKIILSKVFFCELKTFVSENLKDQ